MKIVTLTREEFVKRARESNPGLDEEYSRIAKEINGQTKQQIVLEPLRFISKNVEFEVDMDRCIYK